MHPKLLAFINHHKKQSCGFLAVALVFLAAIAGYIAGIHVEKDNYQDYMRSFKTIRENSDKYSFINPLIGGIAPPATAVGIFSDLKGEIVSYLNEEKRVGELYDYSFYFRDMGTGLWFGANESSSFFPASLFKLPVAIAVYKQSEADPAFLKRSFVYTNELANRNNAIEENSKSNLVIGSSYTIENLVEIMLTKSDNGAKDLLLTSMDLNYLNQLFSVISLADPGSVKTYTISSLKYGYFLRILYGSSYLNEEHSELILKYLSQTTFKDGLVAGIPGSIPVAHKFGVYEFEEEHNGITALTQQLHDCGVVYHAQKPYIFCFMTKGKDLQSLYRVISHVSGLVYQYQENSEQEDIKER